MSLPNMNKPDSLKIEKRNDVEEAFKKFKSKNEFLERLLKKSGNYKVYEELKEKNKVKQERVISKIYLLDKINIREGIDENIYSWNNLFNSKVPLKAYVRNNNRIKKIKLETLIDDKNKYKLKSLTQQKLIEYDLRKERDKLLKERKLFENKLFVSRQLPKIKSNSVHKYNTLNNMSDSFPYKINKSISNDNFNKMLINYRKSIRSSKHNFLSNKSPSKA